jgi:hypothetical protein
VSSMLLFFCGQAGILLNRLLQPPTWLRFNCTVHKYCNLICTYVNNANLNKRLAWTGRTTKDPSWWAISKPWNHFFSSNAHWAVDGNFTHITNKKNPILYVH